MLETLSRDDRLRLLEFVCSFVWVDLEVKPSERAFVQRMVVRLGLKDETELVERWLRRPPPAEEVDPTTVPRAHRELFLHAAKAAFESDRQFDPEEREYLELLEQLLV
jgi:hypothetical protein